MRQTFVTLTHKNKKAPHKGGALIYIESTNYYNCVANTTTVNKLVT